MLCDALCIQLKLEPPCNRYYHGWGQACHDPKPIVCSWMVTVYDRNEMPTSITFDLLQGGSPLVIGLDISRHSNVHNLNKTPYIEISRPADNNPRMLNTYFSRGGGDSDRMLVEIAPRPITLIGSHLSRHLLDKTHRTPRIFPKQIHWHTHARTAQVKELCEHAGVLCPKISSAIGHIDNAC